MLSEKEATPFINHHLIPLSEFLYEELKKVSNNQLSYNHLIFSVEQHILRYHSHFYLLANKEAITRIENMVSFCVEQQKEGLYKLNPCGCRGLLDEEKTRFIDHFEKYLRIILKDCIYGKGNRPHDECIAEL